MRFGSIVKESFMEGRLNSFAMISLVINQNDVRFVTVFETRQDRGIGKITTE